MAEETLAVQSVADMSLPQGWARTMLSDFAHIEAGQSPPGESYNDSGEGTPFFQGKAEFGGLYPAVRKWTTRPTKFAEKDAILLSIRAPVGPTNLSPNRVAIGRGLAGVHPQGGVPSLFVLYGLRNKASELAAQATGTTFSAISADVVRSLPFPLPPLREQERIVTKLEELFSRLDAGLEAVKRTQALLKHYRQSVLRDAVTGELSREWRERHRTDHSDTESAERLLARILAERRARWEQGGRKGKYVEPGGPDTAGLPKLPHGWVWVSVEQLALVGTGATPLRSRADYYENGDIPWVTSGALNSATVHSAEKLITPLAVAETNAKVFPIGTLLVAMYGEGRTRGKIAELGIYAATNQACAALVFEESAQSAKTFVRLFFEKNYDDLRRLSSGGVQPNLNLSIIREMAVPLAPLTEQAIIVSEVERRLSIIDDMEASLVAEVRRAESLRQSILHRAFTGRLVPQDPTDEPASELLKRIHAERGTAGGRGRGQAKVSDTTSASQEGHKRPRKARMGEQAGDTATAGQKRGRGRLRKGEAIPEASTVEEAIRLMEIKKRAKKEEEAMTGLWEK